jgi:hypothetical protein
MKVGFIGAGFIARALAGHLIRNGHEVMLSNSREAKSLRSAAVALNCKVGTAEEAARFGDIVALTVPASAYQNIPAEALIGKIVIDIVNHYPDRDGPIPELENNSLATSELIARSLPGATVIKVRLADGHCLSREMTDMPNSWSCHWWTNAALMRSMRARLRTAGSSNVPVQLTAYH